MALTPGAILAQAKLHSLATLPELSYRICVSLWYSLVLQSTYNTSTQSS